jgi:SAM-dependent methyltransferase
MMPMLPSSTSAVVMGRNGMGDGTGAGALAPFPAPSALGALVALGPAGTPPAPDPLSDRGDSAERAPGAAQGPNDAVGDATGRGYVVPRARSGYVEGYGPSSYGDGMADVYDEWNATRGDIEGAVTAIARLASGVEGDRPVLELGIGSGRLALPLAARGIGVWGVDASDAMVARLRSKAGGDRIPVAIGDMAALDLSTVPGGDIASFSVVFAADNTFFNLTTADAQTSCLGRVRSVLASGGRFVIEAFVPAVDAPASSVDARTVELDRVVLTVTRHDRDAQTVAGQHIEMRASGLRFHPWLIRYTLPEELDAMASAAGLALIQRWSDWRGTPFTPDDNVHVSVYAVADSVAGRA